MPEASKFFASASLVRVLVVGDVMIDRYLSGSVDRISPEAPVPILHLATEDNRLGGAANVALNLLALGATPYLCSVVGDDSNGKLFKSLLAEVGLETRGVIASRERSTTVKTRVLAQRQQLLRVDREDTHDLSKREAHRLLATIRKLLEDKEVDVILLQDYNKGVLSEQVIREVMLEALKADIPTTVDPKERNFWAYRRSTLFKPNLREMQQQANFTVEVDAKSLDRASLLLREQLHNQYVLITLSDRGIYLHDGERGQIFPTLPRSIADVSGAGDTVISVATVALALQLPLPDMAVLANLAGGQVVEKPGVVPVDAAQLAREYAEQFSKGV